MSLRTRSLALVTGALLIAAPAAAQTVAFTDVNVIPMTSADAVLRGQTVVVRDGVIQSIGPSASVRVPDGAQRIAGNGQWLVPGLAEMHAHVPPGNAPPGAVDDMFFLYLANGITTIRGMLGAPHQLALRDSVASGALLGPRFIVGAPSLNGQSAPDAETARRLVREHKAAGYDFLKLHPGLTRAAFDAAVEEARAVGITLGGHVSADVGLARTLEVRQGTIDHLDGYLEATLPDSIHAILVHPTQVISYGEVVRAIDMSRIPELARATRDAGVYNVPTAALWENLYGPITPATAAAWPEMRYVSAQQVQGWTNQKNNINGQLAQDGMTAQDATRMFAFRRQLLKQLADQGAPLLMGTDSPQLFSVPGFSLHREIALMSEAGLTPMQILTAGTSNVGRYLHEVLGMERDAGTVEPGMRADLVLLSANPLDDVTTLARPAGVMAAGRWLDRAALDAGLAAIAARHAR